MKRKPLLFDAACIFSIAGSTIGFVSMAIAAIFFDLISGTIISITNIASTAKFSPMYFAILMVLYCVSLIGAIKIFQQKFFGLILYLSAQTGIMATPVVFLGFGGFSATNAIFSTLFAAVYIYYFRRFRER